MIAPSEKELDAALENAFKSNVAFTRWFLSKTKFADRSATYLWSRSDHPWGIIRHPTINPETGLEEMSLKECETDVLVVLQAEDNEHLALHIENKTAGGKFTLLQPELYQLRAEQWKGNPKYQSYTDFDTVLVAPTRFQERNVAQASLFGSFIAHEEIAEYIPLFGSVQSYACPICNAPLDPIPRYPSYVCRDCGDRAVAPDGRPLSFSNVDFSGGYMARYTDTGAVYPSHECLVDGIRCHADEARFGGIVIEVVNRT